MTTLEKLFIQIFERKDWIIQHVHQQADAYTQQLASRFLIDGITPPPWLLSPSFDSHLSDPKELKKEEIISKLLLRPPQDSVPHSSSICSLYSKPVITGHNGRLSNGICMEVRASNKGLNLSNGPTAGLECCDNDVGCNLNSVPDQDDSVNSPHDETDSRISNIYAAPDQSLARIQRSKSRQKALELRSNMKASAKRSSGNKNREHNSSSGKSLSKNDFHQASQDKSSSELAKHDNITGEIHVTAEEGKCDMRNDRTSYSGRLTRSRSSYGNSGILDGDAKVSGGFSEDGKLDGSNILQPTDNSLLQTEHVDVVAEATNLPDVTFGNHRVRESGTGKASNTQMGSKVHCGRITRSKSSSQRISGLNKSSKSDTSSYNTKEGSGALSHSVGDLMHCLDASSIVLKAFEHPQDLTNRITETQANFSNEGSLKPGDSSNIAAYRVKRSRSGAIKESSLASRNDCEQYALQTSLGSQPIQYFATIDQEGGAEFAVGNKAIVGAVAAKPANSGSNLDDVTLQIEAESLVLMQSSDRGMVVKPKQLDFYDVEECDLNAVHSLHSKKRKLDRSSGQKCSPPEESATSLAHKLSSSFFEQSPLGNDMSSKPKDTWKHPHDNADVCSEDEIMNIEQNINAIPGVENVQFNSEAALHNESFVPCEVNITPSDVCNNCDEEQHPEKHHLIKAYHSSSKVQVEEADLGYKEESASALHVPEPKHSGSYFISILAKQGNKDLHDCLDEDVTIPEPVELPDENFGFTKSKELELQKKFLSLTMKFNSSNVNTWPKNQQRKIEDQPNCSSASRSFRVQLHQNIQRDTIINDLEAADNDLDSASIAELAPLSEEASLSNTNQCWDKRAHQEMICNLTEATESLQRLRAEEAIVSEVDDNIVETFEMLKQSVPNCVASLAKNSADGSTDNLTPEVETANPTNRVVKPGSWCHELDYQPLLPFEDAVSMLDADNINGKITLPEGRCHRGRDGVVSYSPVDSRHSDEKTIICPDDTLPIFEGFTIDEQTENARLESAGGGINFDSLELPSTAIERASILEQICKSTSKQTPISQLVAAVKPHRIQDLYQSMPTGLLESMFLRSTVSLEGDSSKHLRASYSCLSEVNPTFPALPNSDQYSFSSTPFDWHPKNHYSSPVGKLWKRSESGSGSSGKQFSSNPELTCFPIKEDPTSNEENENEEVVTDEFEKDMVSGVANDIAEREPPTESTEVCFQHANAVSAALQLPDRSSLKSVNSDLSFPGSHNRVKHKPKNHRSTKTSRYDGKENQISLFGTRASSRGGVSLHSAYCKPKKTSVRNGVPRLSQKEAKHNNIVSNITSFIPMVQQKQAAAVCTGKRDIKVKALEAAEAAKRREEEKANERKKKKEELKLERARIAKENTRKMVLNKKNQQEEQKKREADLAERKRRREEDERKEKLKKRKHVAETRKEQKLQYKKSRTGKVEKEKPCGENDENADSRKKSEHAAENYRQKGSSDENSFGRHDTELRTDEVLASDVQEVTSALEDRAASSVCGNNEKAISNFGKSPEKADLVMLTSQEKSYNISPYQCSDDEDEEEDDMPTKKFVPSWASRNNVAWALPLQQKLDPEAIFRLEGFCSMDEALLPRRLQLK